MQRFLCFLALTACTPPTTVTIAPLGHPAQPAGTPADPDRPWVVIHEVDGATGRVRESLWRCSLDEEKRPRCVETRWIVGSGTPSGPR